MLRGAPGRRRIKPRSVSTTIMRWAVGGVTWKYAWKSASAGGRRCSLV